jgi:hypothetical protein
VVHRVMSRTKIFFNMGRNRFLSNMMDTVILSIFCNSVI